MRGGGSSRPFLFERGISSAWTLGGSVIPHAVQLIVKVVDDVFEARDLLFKIVALSFCRSPSAGGYLQVPAFHRVEVTLLLLELVLVHVEGVLFAYATAATMHHYAQVRVVSPSFDRAVRLPPRSPFSPLTRCR
jgi:hypothetical protein